MLTVLGSLIINIAFAKAADLDFAVGNDENNLADKNKNGV